MPPKGQVKAALGAFRKGLRRANKIPRKECSQALAIVTLDIQ